MEMLYNFMYKCVLWMGIWAVCKAVCKGWAYRQKSCVRDGHMGSGHV